MHEFYGDLLLGGSRLQHVHGELDQDEVLAGTQDRMLTGRLTISTPHEGLLESGRQYRLQLEDGRAGQVVVSRIESQADTLLVEFEPKPLLAKFRPR
jgi:hypothetical protein